MSLVAPPRSHPTNHNQPTTTNQEKTMEQQTKNTRSNEEVIEDEVVAPVEDTAAATSAVVDEIDSLIQETEQQFDDVLISAVRSEKVERIRQGRTTTGSRAWTMGGSVD